MEKPPGGFVLKRTSADSLSATNHETKSVVRQSSDDVIKVLTMYMSNALRCGVFILDAFNRSPVHAVGYLEVSSHDFLTVVYDMEQFLFEKYPNSLERHLTGFHTTFMFDHKVVHVITKDSGSIAVNSLLDMLSNSRVLHSKILL